MSCEVIFLRFTARAVNAVMASGRRSVRVNIPMKPQRVRSRFSGSKQTVVIVLESRLRFLIVRPHLRVSMQRKKCDPTGSVRDAGSRDFI